MIELAYPKPMIIYAGKNGSEPFTDWFNNISDARDRRRILSRLRRMEKGNWGDYKPLKQGIFELRLFFSSGYRLYFGIDRGQLVVLLLGGNKRSQTSDIDKAVRYWQEYLHHD